jgi:hypothetical protein
MYELKIDRVKNRLYITLEGFFSAEEMKQCSDETIEAVKQLKPEYDVITDISRFSPVGPETLQEITRVQVYFRESGVRHGVRIVGNRVITEMQFKRLGKGVGYTPTDVATLAEAERFLDSQKKGSDTGT